MCRSEKNEKWTMEIDRSEKWKNYRVYKNKTKIDLKSVEQTLKNDRFFKKRTNFPKDFEKK